MKELIQSVNSDNGSTPTTNEGTLGPYSIGLNGIFTINIKIEYKFIENFFKIKYTAELIVLGEAIYIFNVPINSDSLTLTYSVHLKFVTLSLTVTAVVSDDKVCLDANINIIYNIPSQESGNNTYTLDQICIPKPSGS